MNNELALIGVPSHGTKAANQNNVNVEMTIRFKLVDTDVNFVRWKKNYLQMYKVEVAIPAKDFEPERITV
jgi:hypothetical protein